MIILNSKNVNSNFNKILNKYNTMNNLPYMECPICNSTNLIKWGSYNRNINYLNEGNIIYTCIKIKRIKCKDCGHTHALLPSCIIPYRISNLDLILSAIEEEKVTLTFSLDTINRWKNDFNKFLPYLKTIFYNISRIKIISKLKSNIFKYYELFYKINKKILMMIHKGYFNFAYF